MPERRFWGEKRYFSLDYYLKKTYGEKLYKVALNGGCTCPNRDGTCVTRGCIFCSEGGSGDFAASPFLSVKDQLKEGKALIMSKHSGSGCIAYFQAFTNTYGAIEHLRKIFYEAIMEPDVRILSIATRPDCLGEEVLSLLDELNHIKPVWIELGLQTIHPESANFIRRGYDLPVFENAVSALTHLNIQIIFHVILFLPYETESDMLGTITYLNRMPIQGIKLQLLHILKRTDLADYYKEHPFFVPSMEEYFEVLGMCLANLRPDIVVHRLTGDGPKSLLLSPSWTGNKRLVLNSMQKYLKEHDIWQGKEYIEF